MIANFITGSRIIFSLAMLTFPVFSAGFYFFYMLAGFTDMIDGTIARKLGTESKFGRNFDTIADIVFVASSAYKLFPEFKIPRVIWLWTSIIALIKIINIISGFVRKKKITAVHSLANKVTGAVSSVPVAANIDRSGYKIFFNSCVYDCKFCCYTGRIFHFSLQLCRRGMKGFYGKRE